MTLGWSGEIDAVRRAYRGTRNWQSLDKRVRGVLFAYDMALRWNAIRRIELARQRLDRTSEDTP